LTMTMTMTMISPTCLFVAFLLYLAGNDCENGVGVVHGWSTSSTAPPQRSVMTRKPSSSSSSSSSSLSMINRRRSLVEMIQFTTASVAATSFAPFVDSASAAAAGPAASEMQQPQQLPTMPSVDITHKVFMDVRVARTDGSTYVRDDLPDTFDNQVLFCRLKFGLYGNTSPNAVDKFLQYINGGKGAGSRISSTDSSSSYDVDNPYPSYSRSAFPAFDQQTGLLMGGYVPSLRSKDINGSPALTYGSRILPATLWIDNQNANNKISHTTKGLLTHRNLEVLPNFGITTRAEPSLDDTHTVFGCVLWDDETLKFFRDLEDLPTYSVERPSGMDEFGTGSVATSVFNAQREFFRGAAKSFGDDRVSKLYDGKLLRRVEVLQVGVL